MTRTEDRIRQTLDHYANDTRVSPDALEAMARRRDRRRIASWPLAAGLAATGIAAVAGVAILTAPTEPDGPDALGAPGGAAVEADWDDLTTSQAVERLIALNEAQPAPAPLAPGEERVIRSVGAVFNSSDGPDGMRTVRYVGEEETRIAADGSMRMAQRLIDDDVPVTASLADLQALIASAGEGTFSGYTAIESIDDDAMSHAEMLSQGSAQPAPGQTERPDQAYAFMRMLDGFRYAPLVEPEHAIRGLNVIAAIDASIVEYRGLVQDLLGHDVVAFAGYERANASWMVALFDPETGAFAGEYEEFTQPIAGAEGVEPPILGSIASLVSVTVEPAS